MAFYIFLPSMSTNGKKITFETIVPNVVNLLFLRFNWIKANYCCCCCCCGSRYLSKFVVGPSVGCSPKIRICVYIYSLFFFLLQFEYRMLLIWCVFFSHLLYWFSKATDGQSIKWKNEKNRESSKFERKRERKRERWKIERKKMN